MQPGGAVSPQDTGEICIQSKKCKSGCCRREPENCQSYCALKGSEGSACHTQVSGGAGATERGGTHENREPGSRSGPRAQGRRGGEVGRKGPGAGNSPLGMPLPGGWGSLCTDPRWVLTAGTWNPGGGAWGVAMLLFLMRVPALQGSSPRTLKVAL